MEHQYLAQAHKGKTAIWRYVLGILITFLVSTLSSLPYNIVIAQKVSNGVADASKIKDFHYLMSLLDSNITLMFLMLPFVGGLLALYFVVTKMHQLPWVCFTTSRPQIDIQRIKFSFLLWASISILIIFIGFWVAPEQIGLNFNFSKFILLFFIALVLIPIQTSFEEYMFRGYLMQGLGVVFKTKWMPLSITAIVFGLMHLTNPEVAQLGYGVMVFYIATGFLLGVIVLMDGGLELSLGFHVANNLITALLVTTDWTALQTHAVFKDFSTPNLAVELGTIAILYPLLLIFLAKKYRWKNWKEKLI